MPEAFQLRALPDLLLDLAGDEGLDLARQIKIKICYSNFSAQLKSQGRGMFTEHSRSSPYHPSTKKAPICRWQMNALFVAGVRGFKLNEELRSYRAEHFDEWRRLPPTG